ncbi:hypothetical protein D3C75_533370 [compost metagenome]
MGILTATVYLLVDADLTQHTLGQLTFDRDHNAWLARPDQTHRLRGANQKVLLIQPQAAVPVGVHQTGAGQGARGHAHLRLLFAAGGWQATHDLNSGMSGFAPHAQNPAPSAGNCRGWWLASFSGEIRLTPVEYS